jgi:hypothetical protein
VEVGKVGKKGGMMGRIEECGGYVNYFVFWMVKDGGVE